MKPTIDPDYLYASWCDNPNFGGPLHAVTGPLGRLSFQHNVELRCLKYTAITFVPKGIDAEDIDNIFFAYILES